jgi:molecular chaperone HtpG
MPDETTRMRGSLSIESENIFTILKKWLYAERDIVFRELVSNASDAIEKRAARGADAPPGEITVTIDADGGRIVISDNGVGMTADEVDRYINRVAFSGAADFIEQNGDDDGASIIGHFGVGFYSAFTIADRVAIETRSCTDGAEPVLWECGADMEYILREGARTEVGTDVILFVADDCPYLAEPKALHDILRTYFIFLKTPVYLDAPADPEYAHVLVNDTDPVWKRRGADEGTPKDDKALAAFYQEFFDDVMPPLFSVRFESVDIGVSGAIFFRNTKNGKEEIDGTFKVYDRGVFVGDNIPSLIPKFVNLQSGVVDCRDLPLVVSREGIRDGGGGDGDGEASLTELIYETLTQEVTIAVNSLFTDARDRYEAMWPHLNAFVKYSVLQDKIFASVMTRRVIFEDLYGKFHTIP